MTIFSNPWFVGISTGIISGVLVFFLTKWIMDKRGKAEYFKQVHNADQNVINALKPYIADNGLPEREIFEALIASAARSFCVDRSDMFSIDIYCEELIREIISDVYVSNEKKQEYANALVEYKRNLENNKEKLKNVYGISSISSNYGARMRRLTSIYISFSTAVLGMVSSVIIMFDNENIQEKNFWYPFDKTPILWVPIFLLILVLIIIISIMTLEVMYKRLRHRKNEVRNED